MFQKELKCITAAENHFLITGCITHYIIIFKHRPNVQIFVIIEQFDLSSVKFIQTQDFALFGRLVGSCIKHAHLHCRSFLPCRIIKFAVQYDRGLSFDNSYKHICFIKFYGDSRGSGIEITAAKQKCRSKQQKYFLHM